MRILVIAYACEPEKGSEPGVGWVWSRMLAQLGETWVVTRANNRNAIEESLSLLPPEERPRFSYVELPRWARFWKRGEHGVRLYYVLWQVLALRRLRRWQQEQPFDFVWHLSLANAWLGSVGAWVGAPFIYGPVGGGSRSCWDPRIVGVRGLAYETARAGSVSLSRYVNPLARESWRRAVLILAQNDDTVQWLPARHRKKARVMPNVAVDVPPESPRRDQPRVALFAGRLLPWKGGALAIRTMQHLRDWQLVFYGTGPDEPRLRRLARRLRVDDRITFRGWVPRNELLEFMRSDAGLLLFPSVHDEAGWIVGEALTLGLPAICINRGGPPALGADCVELRGASRTAKSLAEVARRAHQGRPLPRWDMEFRYAELRRLLEESNLVSGVEL
jgi:glycosyltransferase involved in cell wall biosynthesis